MPGRQQRARQVRRSQFDISDQRGHISNVGGDQHNYYDPDAAQLEMLRQAPTWVKALVALAVALCISGIATAAIGAFSTPSDPGAPNFGDMPVAVPIGGAMFFVGFIMAAIASLATALRRRS